MKHSVEELREVVYRYYPRIALVDVPGFGRVPDLVNPPLGRRRDLPPDAWPPSGHDETEEHRRLAGLRVEAGNNRRAWTPVINAIRAGFPDRLVSDHSLNLLSPDGDGDSGYAGSVVLPPRTLAEEDHTLKFALSFLAPYYVIWASSWSGSEPIMELTANDIDVSASAEKNVDVESLVPGSPEGQSMVDAKGLSVLYLPDSSVPSKGCRIPAYEYHFALTQDEQRYAQAVLETLRSVFPGYEPLPSEAGLTSVPDVFINCRAFGQATLYDCLFTTSW